MTEIYIQPRNINSSGNVILENYTLIDTFDKVALPNTYQIIDLTSLDGGPGERMGGGSQTLTFPGTKNNNIIFGFIFEIDIANCLFDARLKANCIVYQDKIPVAEGILQLQTISIIDKSIQYNCQLTFGFTSFISQMTGVSGTDNPDFLLSDLYIPSRGDSGNEPFSGLDHTYNAANQAASWSATKGIGYVYPMIDFGQNDLNGWFVNQLYPAIYVKEYIDRIFAFCGFTYTSTFFNSTLFKRLIIPFTNGLLGYTQAEIANRIFDVTLSTASTSVGTIPSPTKVPFDTIVSDIGSNWDNTNHKWTVLSGRAGIYMLTATIYVTWSAGSRGLVAIYRNGIVVAETGYGNDGNAGTNVPIVVTWQSVNYSSAQLVSSIFSGYSNDQMSNEGDYFEVYIGKSAGTSSFKSNSEFYSQVINSGLTSGNLCKMADAVPENILMKDFFISIVKMFNLYVDVDSNSSTNLIIEPRQDFYAAGKVIDWTQKLAKDKEIISTPLGMINAKNYLFSYSKDNDFWNAYYSSLYYTLDHNDIYGERQIGTTNDFQYSNLKTDVIFAPSPLVFYTQPIGYTGQPGAAGYVNENTKILTTIHPGGQTDSVINTQNATKPANCAIRILQFSNITGNWVHLEVDPTTSNTNHTNYTSYPYAGHFDHPTNPTVDINFGVTATLFYNFIGQNIININLFHEYYEAMMNELTDPDSKVVTLYLKLNPSDILSLDFRNTILIDNTYYKLLEITDYDMSCYQLTQCKLLKSDTKPKSPSSNLIANGGTGSVGLEALPTLKNQNFNPGFLKLDAFLNVGGIGNKINDKAQNISITGNNNQVTGNVMTVSIIGGENNIVNANNVTLINCNGLNITDNDVVYIDNILQPPTGGTGTVTIVSVATANGFYGTVATATTTPAITVKTSVTGLLKGNGTAISAANSSDLNSIFGYVPMSTGHQVFTPTTGNTVNLVGNQYNIINPVGTLLALTLNLPSSPNNNDFCFIKFTQNITTVTYSGGSIADSIVSPVAGGLLMLVYDLVTTKWY